MQTLYTRDLAISKVGVMLNYSLSIRGTESHRGQSVYIDKYVRIVVDMWDEKILIFSFDQVHFSREQLSTFYSWTFSHCFMLSMFVNITPF